MLRAYSDRIIAIAVGMALDVLVPQDRQRDVLALEFAMDRRPVGLRLTPVSLVPIAN
jgi:hypothetical protein